MKSRFEEIKRGEFIIVLMPESLSEIEFLDYYNDSDKEQHNTLHSYYTQAIEKRFAKEAYLSYCKPYSNYPKSMACNIKFPSMNKSQKTVGY